MLKYQDADSNGNVQNVTVENKFTSGGLFLLMAGSGTQGPVHEGLLVVDSIGTRRLVPLLLPCSHFLLILWETLESNEHSYD